MSITHDVRSGTRWVRRLCVSGLLLVSVATPSAQPGRIVAVGDVHGAIGEFRALLQTLELTDADQGWIGGQDTLVQTGDLTDRGTGVRAVLDLLMHLETEADEAGGEVIVVLGNHETMSFMANLRHTTPELLSRSVWSDSTSRREAAYNDYLALAADRADALGPLAPEPLSRDAWLDAHPPGFLKYLDAFGPDGLYGRCCVQRRLWCVSGTPSFCTADYTQRSADSCSGPCRALSFLAKSESKRRDSSQRELLQTSGNRRKHSRAHTPPVVLFPSES